MDVRRWRGAGLLLADGTAVSGQLSVTSRGGGFLAFFRGGQKDARNFALDLIESKISPKNWFYTTSIGFVKYWIRVLVEFRQLVSYCSSWNSKGGRRRSSGAWDFAFRLKVGFAASVSGVFGRFRWFDTRNALKVGQPFAITARTTPSHLTVIYHSSCKLPNLLFFF